MPLLKNSKQRNVSKARNISGRTRPIFIGGDIDLSHLVVEKWSEEGQLIASEQYPLEDLSPLAEEGQWVETKANYEIGECEGCSIKAYVQTVAERDLLVEDFEVVHEKEQVKVVNTKSYYPFGSLLSYAEDSTLSTTANSRRNYQGSFAEWDEETSYATFELRLMDPVIGRWMAPDPMRQHFSPYLSMGNDPINRVDSDGGVDDFYIYSDGSIERVITGSTHNFYYVDENNTTTFINSFTENVNGLIQLPDDFSFYKNGISFGFSVKSGQSNRAYISPESMASLFGAFIETGFSDFTVTQFSYSDGGSPSPSVSHVNGKNGDFRYLRKDGAGSPVNVTDSAFDPIRNPQFTKALHKYGYRDLKSYNNNGYLLPKTSHLKGHNNHLHLQGFRSPIQNTKLPRVFDGPRLPSY